MKILTFFGFLSLFLLPILLLNYVSADIISINSFGNYSVLTSSKSIEGFYFGDYIAPVVGVEGGAGGSGSDPLIQRLNFTICNITYYHILENGNSTLGIPLLQKELESYNISVNYLTLREDYLPFQGLCSEVINRTLEEEFVCKSIKESTPENNEEIVALKKEIDKKIPITFNLLSFYVNNYKKWCLEEGIKKEEKPFSIFNIQEGEENWYWIIFAIIGFLLILFFLFLFIRRRRKRDERN